MKFLTIQSYKGPLLLLTAFWSFLAVPALAVDEGVSTSCPDIFWGGHSKIQPERYSWKRQVITLRQDYKYRASMGGEFYRNVHLSLVNARAHKKDQWRYIFFTDGQVMRHYAAELRRQGKENIVLVGIESTKDLRAKEYCKDSQLAEYAKHQDFFTRAVFDLVERELGVEKIPAARTAIFGHSNGAIFAMETLVRFPQKFGSAIVLSSPRAVSRVKGIENLAPSSRIVVGSGNRGAERPAGGFYRNMAGYADFLEQNGIEHRYAVIDSNHEHTYWPSVLAESLEFLFPG